MSDFYHMMRDQLQTMEEEAEAATDLWSWLPSQHAAQVCNEDYYFEFQPTLAEVVREASAEIIRLREMLVANGAIESKYGPEAFGDSMLSDEKLREICGCGQPRGLHWSQDGFMGCSDGLEFHLPEKEESA